MQFKTILNSRLTAVVAGGAVITVLGATAGFAAANITSADIANETIRSKDVMNGTLKPADFSNAAEKSLQGERGAQGPAGADGARGEQGPPGASGTYVGEHWSIIDRNVIGNGDSYLRSGPGDAPYGVGSLGLRTGGPGDKASFGNQVEFRNDPLADIETVKYSMFNTNENNALYNENGIGISMELDPTGPDDSTGPNYTTLVYVPTATPGSVWTVKDASTEARWFMTGAASNGSCNQGPEGYCTLEQVKEKFENASILSVQFTKGRDYAFSGAVDGLQLNDTVYDFEPFGVSETAAP